MKFNNKQFKIKAKMHFRKRKFDHMYNVYENVIFNIKQKVGMKKSNHKHDYFTKLNHKKTFCFKCVF